MFGTVILLCQAAFAVLDSKHLIHQTLRFWNPWRTSHDKTILRAVFMYTLVFIQTLWSAFCTNQKKPNHAITCSVKSCPFFSILCSCKSSSIFARLRVTNNRHLFYGIFFYTLHSFCSPKCREIFFHPFYKKPSSLNSDGYNPCHKYFHSAYRVISTGI